MTINAPYNFAPLADEVYLPPWADQVTHDIPFKDGYCGEIELTITAHSPILVGGKQVHPTGEAGNVYFYQQPDGKYAIPGTSLKGMLRAVLEVATFSRMRQVDDMRYGLRDITCEYTKAVYPKAVVGKQKVGYMQLGDDNKVTITPCKFAKVRHEDIEARLGIKPKPYLFDKSEPSVPEKYKAWASRKQVVTNAGLNPFTFNTEPANDRSGHQRAIDLGKGKLTGTLVLTGQINDRSQKDGKHHDFLFYDANSTEKLDVEERDWQNFLFVHDDQGKQKVDGAWFGYWKERFYQREPVPVFYVPRKTGGQGGVHIGLALLLKLAGDFSVHDLIGRQSAHLDTCRGFDFGDLLFGATDNLKHGALKSRVSFLPAIAQGNVRPAATAATILNSPKASYFPNYLVQKQLGGTLSSASYATYVDSNDLSHQPGIRGWKRYPVHAKNVGVQALTGDQITNKAVQTILYPLPGNTVFKTQLSFHNLRDIELGAVLWALLWGDANATEYRHSIGMGKPFGFGQISVSLGKFNLRANDPAQATAAAIAPDAAALIKTFEAHMETAHTEKCWAASPQIVNLKAMANHVIGDDLGKRQFKGHLKHMVMDMGNSNAFVAAKKAGSVLPLYAIGTDVPLKARDKNAVVKTQRQLEELAIKLAREIKAQQAFEDKLAQLSPNLKRVEAYKLACAGRVKQLTRNNQDKTYTRDKAHGDFHRMANDLAKAAHEGADWSAEEKSVAADAIEEWLPKIVSIEMKDERKKLKLNMLKGK